VTISTRRALAMLAGFWATLLPLFAAWLWIDQGIAPWDLSMHAGLVLRLHDGLAKGNLWRAYELSRFYPPLFHVLAVPASFVSTHPDAYSFGNWLVLLGLLWLTFLLVRHWRATGRDVRAPAFLRPLGRVLVWPLLLAGPWYVRSVPSLVGKAWWHLGFGVVADEGDPPVLSVASLAYYGQQLRAGYLRAPLVLLLVAGAVALLVAWTWKRRDATTIAPARAWAPLLLGVAGGFACLLLIANKDPRYLLPFMPLLAVVCGTSVTLLRAEGQRTAIVACGVLAWLLAADALFRLEPPDPTDWKLAEVARQIVPRLDGATTPLRILVVPNDERMNFTSLDYALLRATRAKTQVERSDRALDAARLATYDLAVVVVPPPDETPVSQGSRAAAELVLSRPEWGEEARIVRGDGGEILMIAWCAPGREPLDAPARPCGRGEPRAGSIARGRADADVRRRRVADAAGRRSCVARTRRSRGAARRSCARASARRRRSSAARSSRSVRRCSRSRPAPRPRSATGPTRRTRRRSSSGAA